MQNFRTSLSLVIANNVADPLYSTFLNKPLQDDAVRRRATQIRRQIPGNTGQVQPTCR